MTTTMSYKEWLDSQKATALTARDEAVTAANKAYDTSMYAAALQRQASQPTYGAAAEALGSAGLTGSGYSNYLKQSADEAFRMNADTARQTQKATLADATKLYEKNVADAQNAYDAAMYDAYNKMVEGINNGEYTTKEVEDAYKAGNLSDGYYNQLKTALNEQYNTQYDSLDGFGTGDGGLISKSEADQIVASMEGSTMFDQATIDKVKKLREYLYTPYQAGAHERSGSTNGYTSDANDTDNKPDFDDEGFAEVRIAVGDRGDIDGDGERETYADGSKHKKKEFVRVKKLDTTEAEKAELSIVSEVGANVVTGHFFYWNDNIYLKGGDGIFWKVDKKGNPDQYAKIYYYIAQNMPTDYAKIISGNQQ